MPCKVVLLIEDNVDDLTLTIRSIRRAYSDAIIVVANDGAEADAYLDSLQAQGSAAVLPDIVILDIKMPKLDGIQLLRKIRKDANLRRLAVVVFSSGHDEEEIREAVHLGAIYVQKPVDYKAFQGAVSEIIQNRMMNNPIFFDA